MDRQPVSFEPPRGMRDFYPEEMALRERVFSAWREAARLCGFSPYDACVVESLELLQRKAGEEVTAQIYSFEDKSGRKLALRAEMTPTLARMVAARQGGLRFPLKWTAIAQCFRYERMTRGRKREHYQWNVDVVGEESVLAEAEVLNAAATALRKMGLPDEAWRIHVSSRALLSELLAGLGLEASTHAAVFLALDKRGKVPDDEIAALLKCGGVSDEGVERVFRLMELKSLDEAETIAGADSPAILRLRELFKLATIYGYADNLLFDISVIRGLSYYTGIVFEAFDTERKFRAIFGGGRYDNLLTSIGGAPTPAVGLGFGDVVVQEVLKDILGDGGHRREDRVAIGHMTQGERDAAVALATKLRADGRAVDLALSAQKPKAFFKAAGDSTAAYAVFIGPDDVASGTAKMKNLETREEQPLSLD